MFRPIEGLPPHVFGVEASSQVTHQDYRDFLGPQVDKLITHGPVNMLYAIALAARRLQRFRSAFPGRGASFSPVGNGGS